MYSFKGYFLLVTTMKKKKKIIVNELVLNIKIHLLVSQQYVLWFSIVQVSGLY